MSVETIAPLRGAPPPRTLRRKPSSRQKKIARLTRSST